MVHGLLYLKVLESTKYIQVLNIGISTSTPAEIQVQVLSNVYLKYLSTSTHVLGPISDFNTSMVVSVGEDATRVISRIEYDSETDKLVGFVLPCDQDGLPICDLFIATSFGTMESYFDNASLAKYAFVYVLFQDIMWMLTMMIKMMMMIMMKW